MKKIFALIAALVLIVGTAMPAYAGGQSGRKIR
jgi:hypothetical protein